MSGPFSFPRNTMPSPSSRDPQLLIDDIYVTVLTAHGAALHVTLWSATRPRLQGALLLEHYSGARVCLVVDNPTWQPAEGINTTGFEVVLVFTDVFPRRGDDFTVTWIPPLPEMPSLEAEVERFRNTVASAANAAEAWLAQPGSAASTDSDNSGVVFIDVSSEHLELRLAVPRSLRATFHGDARVEAVPERSESGEPVTLRVLRPDAWGGPLPHAWCFTLASADGDLRWAVDVKKG